jgi:glucose-1-phosphate cytidylyltransferase
MRVVVFAGGLGTRLREETQLRPKPMVMIGNRPILWHILKIYGHFGYDEFVVLCGYKGEVIREYFLNYHALESQAITVDLAHPDKVEFHRKPQESWKVTLLDTGGNTATGGRLKRAREYLSQGTFMATYGDGVANVDLKALLACHRRNRKLATVTAVRPSSRFGDLQLNGEDVVFFNEKPQVGEGWINGGFFVFEPEIFEHIQGDQSTLEADTLTQLARNNQLAVYRHEGEWRCMDTYRELCALEEEWRSGNPSWKVWS